MDLKIEELYKKYLKLSIPNKYLLSDVEDILINEYLAKSLDKKEMDFLVDLQEINKYDKCFIIDKDEILNNLFTEQEKREFVSLKELNKQFPLDPDKSTKSEVEYTRIQEGEYLVIFLGVDSEDYLKDIKLIGNSEKLFDRLIVLMGIDKEDCNLENREFHDYLRSLSNLGYLKSD
ncbi:hypothetical protein P6P90_16760 [Ectobacillus antri]|uniref:Uncharacterized protein n=1 Tax=Ectobacillus antri TaxID=2486280 RepID=A0ABT6H8F6_9BACI|nr:hypothetical protein [Ectobacillus antri]MDG4658550.1 hypothetical protein [Ectobacillus antri]MDG5755548.1 hypothetical protein [Ectobacillus antri]